MRDWLVNEFGTKATLANIQWTTFIIIVMAALMAVPLPAPAPRWARFYFLLSTGALMFHVAVVTTYSEPPSWWGNLFWINLMIASGALLVAHIRSSER